MVQDPWAKFDIKVRLGAGYAGDQTLLSQFTGEDEAKFSGFRFNSPDCMTND